MNNKSLNAALLSALVFPGSGHLYLRCFKTGVVLIAISLVATAFIVNFIVSQVRAIADQVLEGAVALDPAAIAEQVRTSIYTTDLTNIRVALWVLVICWVIGILDSYRAGRRMPQ